MPDSQYVIVFMGYGHLSSLIEGHSSNFDNIYLMPAVMPEQVLEYTASADAGVAFIDNGSLNDEFCLPNKLFECIFSGLPVVVNNAPEMAKLVEEFDIGVVIDNMNVTELSLALKHIDEMDTAVLADNLENAKANLSWEVQEKILLSGYRTYAGL